MFSSRHGAFLWNAWQIDLAVAALLLGLAEEYGQLFTRLSRAPNYIRAAVAVLLLLAMELFTASGTPSPLRLLSVLTSYSARSASTGFTEAARRAGK